MSTKTSNYTRQLRVKYWLLVVIDLIILVAPLLGFSIYALMQPVSNIRMIIFISCTVVSAMIVIFNLLSKRHIRCVVWLMFVGLYAVLQDIMPLVMTVAIASIIDDIVLCPMIEHYRVKLLSSKTIDDRAAYEERI